MTRQEVDIARLRWACRRGMLELDLLLLPFLEHRYRYLSTTDQRDFMNLLSCTDQELFSWLVHQQSSINTDLHAIVALVIQHATSHL
jgi:antitoxin CptB